MSNISTAKLLDELEPICELMSDPHVIKGKIPLYEEQLSPNGYLSKPTVFYWNYPYHSFSSCYSEHPLFLNFLKNDFGNRDKSQLYSSGSKAFIALYTTLEKLSKIYPEAVVCAVPRSKEIGQYNVEQLFFYVALAGALSRIPCLENGVAEYHVSSDPFSVKTSNVFDLGGGKSIDFGTAVIKRKVSTSPTHLSHKSGMGRVSCGITEKTCEMNGEAINGKTVILVDDIYTKTVNVDEDAIEALYKAGAERVVFYAVGKTIR